MIKPNAVAFKQAMLYEINNRFVFQKAIELYGLPDDNYRVPWFLRPLHKYNERLFVTRFENNSGFPESMSLQGITEEEYDEMKKVAV